MIPTSENKNQIKIQIIYSPNRIDIIGKGNYANIKITWLTDSRNTKAVDRTLSTVQPWHEHLKSFLISQTTNRVRIHNCMHRSQQY